MSDLFAKAFHYKKKCEWFAILLVRLVLGSFFIITGFFKIFDASQHYLLLSTLVDAQIPMPYLTVYLIPVLECICGLGVLLGFYTSFSSLILFILVISALIVTKFSSAYGGFVYVEHFLYLPEVLYALLFLWLFLSGPGKASIDFMRHKRN